MPGPSRAEKRAARKRRRHELLEQERAIEAAIEARKHEAPDHVEFEQDPVHESPLYATFRHVFDKFTPQHEEEHHVEHVAERELDEDDTSSSEDELPILTAKDSKRRKRMSIAELKQRVEEPRLVSTHDGNSIEPVLLVQLKSVRNTIPVPDHWSQRRKYLQGKRGYLKPPFSLPKFIQDTGISQMRDSLIKAEQDKSMKQQARERMQPKMGRLDLDYQAMYDAFFKYQTKPQLTRQGQVYYEGKEFQSRLENKRPGSISKKLRMALGMAKGAPPPWLKPMQRFGPPPSYPTLRIPGLNAPLPVGASYGAEPNQWGRPPVDSHNRPLYGNPFDEPGTLERASHAGLRLWGEPYEEAVDE